MYFVPDEGEVKSKQETYLFIAKSFLHSTLIFYFGFHWTLDVTLSVRPDLAKFRHFGNFFYCFAFLGLVSIWQHLEPGLAIFTISIGQFFMVVKAKFWKMILPSGHTGHFVCNFANHKMVRSMSFKKNDPKFRIFWKKWASSGLFFVYFWSFQTNNTTFTTNVKNVQRVSSAGIRTNDLLNMRASSHNH